MLAYSRLKLNIFIILWLSKFVFPRQVYIVNGYQDSFYVIELMTISNFQTILLPNVFIYI